VQQAQHLHAVAKDPVDDDSRLGRVVVQGPSGPAVRRLHIIDACQASDLPVTYKYERNFGSGERVRKLREGVSFETLFNRVEQTVNKALARLTLLRWALFQFLIGNSDTHGKNFSFFVHREGLEPAPWYDLVGVVQYPNIDHGLAMAFGDAFAFAEVGALQLADFAKRCGINRTLLKREAAKLSKLTAEEAPLQAQAVEYVDEEPNFAAQLRDFIVGQVTRLTSLANEAAKVEGESL
jgi:serine/threonine-protein kinase HipA